MCVRFNQFPYPISNSVSINLETQLIFTIHTDAYALLSFKIILLVQNIYNKNFSYLNLNLSLFIFFFLIFYYFFYFFARLFV